MTQMEELIGFLTEKLENQLQMGRGTGNMPRFPMAILYSGEYAAEAKEDISDTLHRVWRRRSEAVGHILLDEIVDGNGIDTERFQDKIDSRYDFDTHYQDMNDFFLCVVFDSRDFSSPEDFWESYQRIIFLKESCGQDHCYTMSILFLDQSAAGRKISRQILDYLRNLLEEGKQVYRSTVLLSNRLYNGSLLRKERFRENYRLAGNILALANSAGGNHSVPTDMFFPSERGNYYLTASYSRVNRPNEMICEIILGKLLDWLREKISKGEKIDPDKLRDKLGIADFVSKFFQEHMQNSLPPGSALDALPRIMDRDAELDTPLSALPYRLFERQTRGSGKVFWENRTGNVSESTKAVFVESFGQHIAGKVSMGEARGSLSDQTIDLILDELSGGEPSDRQSAYSYLLETAEKAFTEAVKPICRKQLQILREKSEKQLRQINALCEEFLDSRLTVDNGQNLQEYYARLAVNFTDGTGGADAWRRFGESGSEREEIVSLLTKMAEGIFTSNPIFCASLTDEMTARMGENPVVIQNTIRDELSRGLSERIRFRSLSTMVMLWEVILVNQQEENGEENALFQSLQTAKKGQNNVAFYDTGDENTIEIVRLYRCDQSSL